MVISETNKKMKAAMLIVTCVNKNLIIWSGASQSARVKADIAIIIVDKWNKTVTSYKESFRLV